MERSTVRNITIIIVLLALVAAGVWFYKKDEKKTEVVTPILSVSAFNQTQGKDASGVSAHPHDSVAFNLTAENPSDKVIPGYVVQVNIADITSKATLIDASGASYNSATNSLVWTPLDIPAKSHIEKQFVVRINDIAVNSDNVLKLQFNNELRIGLEKPIVSGVAINTPQDNYKAPTTGTSSSWVVLLSLATTIGYFGIRKFRFKLGDNPR